MKRIAIKNICEVYDGPHATPKKTETGPVYLGIDAITEDGMLDSSQFSYLSKNMCVIIDPNIARYSL